MKLRVFTSLAIAALLATPSFAQKTFNGGDGDWFNNLNWTGGDGLPPTATDDATLNFSSGTATINGADAVAQSLTINFGSDLAVTSNRLDVGSGGITMASARTVTVSGAVLESGGGHVDRGGTFNGGGTMNFSSGTLNFSNDGNFTLSGGTTLNTSANVTKTDRGNLTIAGATWNNSGTMSFTSMGAPSPVMDLMGANSQFNNTGTFSVTGGQTLNVNSNNASAVFTNGSGGIIDVADNTSVVFANFADAGGSINLGANASINTGGSLTLNGGTVSGVGTVNGSPNLTVVGGNVSPGTSPGTLTIAGNLTLDNSTLNIEIDGVGGSAIDLLDVNGTVSLINGTDVNVVGLGSLNLLGTAIGTRFKFLEANAAITDTFATSVFDLGHAELTVGYNDGALGGTGNAYLELTAVPEPSSFALVGIATVGAVLRRRRR